MAADGDCHHLCKLMALVRHRWSINDVIGGIRNTVMPSDCLPSPDFPGSQYSDTFCSVWVVSCGKFGRSPPVQIRIKVILSNLAHRAEIRSSSDDINAAQMSSLMLAGNEFQSLGRAIVKEDEYEEVRWDGIVSIVSWRERVFRLWWEERPHIDVSLTCEHDPKFQEYCVCPQNMPQFDSEGIPNQAPETNKPMILNGPTSRNREGSDQTVVADLEDLLRRIVAACATVTPEMLRNTWQELEYRLDICRAKEVPKSLLVVIRNFGSPFVNSRKQHFHPSIICGGGNELAILPYYLLA
ncbi:hypothetical protein ANN_10336 [Periplaneta americana]|uniref:Uncharacterized protein n=1 Tax=Periplaneta americana TaxID=6978 RepID=A0ABQ8TR01_PERAM|nr:hypothetical protein ANN_10336 [Periplaneta americana]